MTARYRVWVCRGMDCRARGAESVFAALQEETAKGAPCQLNRGGCYGLCQFGPNVVVRPDTGAKPDPFSQENYRLMNTPGEVHHAGMTPENARALVLAMESAADD